MAINCEAANFDKMTRGDIDEAFDATTINPGKYLLEKMVAGGYLGGLCSRILLAAAAEKVILKGSIPHLEAIGPLSAAQLDGLLAGTLGEDEQFTKFKPDDLVTMKTILSEVVERAALLTAINISAVVLKSMPENARKKAIISIDGSTYYKLFSFRERAERYVAQILTSNNVEYQIVQIQDAPVIGAAVAGLS